jgi:hypothetical protein
MWLVPVKMKWILHVSENFSKVDQQWFFFYPYHINGPLRITKHTTNSYIIKYIGPWKKENILRDVGLSLHTQVADYAVANSLHSVHVKVSNLK